MGRMRARAMILSILLVAVLVAAVAWVSVPFTDRAADCGTAVGAARHGMVVPVVRTPLSAADRAGEASGGFALTIGPGGNSYLVTYCRGAARLRIVESTIVALVAVGVTVASRRRRAQPPPVPLGV